VKFYFYDVLGFLKEYLLLMSSVIWQ